MAAEHYSRYPWPLPLSFAACRMAFPNFSSLIVVMSRTSHPRALFATVVAASTLRRMLIVVGVDAICRAMPTPASTRATTFAASSRALAPSRLVPRT